MNMRLGIFGGSFDPIHTAHLILAEWVRGERSLDRVLFVPALEPPHKASKHLAPPAHRMRMVQLAIEDNPAFDASAVELERQGPSYTLLTVRQLRERLGPDARLYLILGADSVHEIATWWRVRELVEEVEIIAVGRPGHSLQADLEALAGAFGDAWARRVGELKVDVPPMAISATDIRGRVAAGRSIRYLVPDVVRDYILRHGLYGAP